MHFVAAITAVVRSVAQFVAGDAHAIVARKLDAFVATIGRFVASILAIRMAVAHKRCGNALQRMLAPELRVGALDASAVLWILIAAIQTRCDAVAQRGVPYTSIAITAETHFAQIRAIQFGVARAIVSERFVGRISAVIVAIADVLLIDAFIETLASKLFGTTWIRLGYFSRCVRHTFRSH